MKKVEGFVGVAIARVLGGSAKILFGRATAGEEDVYEPLTINGITPFESPGKASGMMIHLRQRQKDNVEEAYLAKLEMYIAENAEELNDRVFMCSDQPLIVLRRHGDGEDVDFIGVYENGVPGFPEVPGSDLQFNGLEGFDCYRDVLEVSRQTTSTTCEFCPIATFRLTKVPG